MSAPKCEMRTNCTAPVTHIGEKGYIYCLEHAELRRPVERTRALSDGELALIREGKPIPSYHHPRRSAAARD